VAAFALTRNPRSDNARIQKRMAYFFPDFSVALDYQKSRAGSNAPP